MPLTKCPECGHEMSSSAPACPNCGWQPIAAQQAPDKVVYVADAPEEKSGCSLGTIIIGLLVGLGIFALLIFLFYPYITGEQPPATNTVNVNLTIEAQNKQTTEIIITTPEPRETPPPPTPRPTQPPPTPRPTPEKPTPPQPQGGSNSRSNGNK